jgi:polysaccharide export outer membrane protein
MNLMTFVLSILLVGSSAVGFQTTGQTPVSRSTEAPVSPPVHPAGNPLGPPAAAYRIGPDDEINLVVVGEETLTKVYRVRADGGISLPYVEDTIIAQGLTAIELQERIRVALKSVILSPQVRVDVSKYGSQFVMVQGEVRDPQRVPMTGPMTVMDALAAAGSPTSNAGTRATIARPNPNGAGDPQRFDVNLTDLRNGVTGANLPLVGGDIINVPKAEMFYVQGKVKSVGSYIWEPGLTVDQAITKAGGVDDHGKKSGLKVTRTINGKSKTIDVKSTDLVLANDTIIVPQRMF